MTGRTRRICWVTAILAGAGALRMPVEAAWTARMREDGLLQEEVRGVVGAKLGQTFFAVSMSGLRTLVATWFNLRVQGYFEMRDWERVHETHEIMVALAPRTGEYWMAGAHSQAMNAASYYRHAKDLEMAAPRRLAMWRASVIRGRDFAERGVRILPGDWKLRVYLAMLLTNRHSYQAFADADEAFEAAACAYREAAALPGTDPYLKRMELYTLARVAGRRAEALALSRALYADEDNRVATLRCVHFTLEMGAGGGRSRHPVAFAEEVFGSKPRALEELVHYWRNGMPRMPMDGVALTIRMLEEDAGVPPDRSALRKSPDAGPDGDGN